MSTEPAFEKLHRLINEAVPDLGTRTPIYKAIEDWQSELDAEPSCDLLLSVYLSCLKRGEDPDQSDFIAACPPSHHEKLKMLLGTVRGIHRYMQDSHVSPEVVERTIKGLEAIRDRKRAEAAQKAGSA